MPNGGVEKVGVEAVAEGVAKFLRDMQAMERSYDSFTGGISKGAPAAAGATEGLGLAAGIAAGGVAALAMGALQAAQAIGQTLFNALKSATAAVTEFLGEGLQLAGQFQEQEFAALAIGRAMGLQEKEIRDAIDTLNDANIRYDVAAKVTSQLIRNQIDLAKAFDLARVAQATGVIVGEDSSETLQRLVWAATTHNTVMLRKMGIMVDLTAAEERYAVSIGKTVDALTQQEKTQSAVDAVIAASANLMDVYAAAMKSPTKALRSLSQRVIPELQASLMQVFLPAWLTVIQAVMRFADVLKEAVSEGGALYPVMVRLGAIAAILADAFSAALDVASEFITSLGTGLGQGMEDIIFAALEWGANIVAALARGMIEASIAVLVPVLTAIGDMLSFFLGPGSPPRIAPGLPKWGAAAMEEYLRGFTMADFGVLEGLQSLLRQALSGPEFAAASQEIARALAFGADETFFERLAKASGKYGQQIADLARMEFELADATKALADANKRYEQSQKKVSSLTAEYNDLLREGAAKDILDAKLEQIKAAEDERDAAADDAEAAETNIDALKDQTDLQRKMVQQLLMLAKAMETATSKAAKMRRVGAGAAADLLRGIGLPAPGEWGISDALEREIRLMKIRLRGRLRKALQPLTDAWAEVQDDMTALGDAWREMTGIGINESKKLEKGVSPILQRLWQWYRFTMPKAILETNNAFWTLVHDGATALHDYVGNTLIPKLNDLIVVLMGGKGAKGADENSLFGAITAIIGLILTGLLGPEGAFVELRNYIATWLLEAWEWLLEKVQDVGEAIGTIATYLVNTKTAWEALMRAIGMSAEQLETAPPLGTSQSAPSMGSMPASSMMQSSQITYSAPVSVGPNYISGGLDAAAVEALAVRAVEKALRRTV